MMHRVRIHASSQARRRSFATKKNAESNNLQEKVVALCRHRGFIFPGSEIYGGLANSFDYGPLGTIVCRKNLLTRRWKTLMPGRLLCDTQVRR